MGNTIVLVWEMFTSGFVVAQKCLVLKFPNVGFRARDHRSYFFTETVRMSFFTSTGLKS